MRIIVFVAALVFCLSADAAWSAGDSSRYAEAPHSNRISRMHQDGRVSPSRESSERISRPAQAVYKFTQYYEKTDDQDDWFSTTGGATPICSSNQSSNEENHTCCDITSKYFPIKIAGPSQHFGLWLRLNLYPTLCHSVLCQRQCALNGYESCNALGDERSLIERFNENYGDCSSGRGSVGSCCADHENKMSSEEGDRTQR